MLNRKNSSRAIPYLLFLRCNPKKRVDGHVHTLTRGNLNKKDFSAFSPFSVSILFLSRHFAISITAGSLLRFVNLLGSQNEKTLYAARTACFDLSAPNIGSRRHFFRVYWGRVDFNGDAACGTEWRSCRVAWIRRNLLEELIADRSDNKIHVCH